MREYQFLTRIIYSVFGYCFFQNTHVIWFGSRTLSQFITMYICLNFHVESTQLILGMPALKGLTVEVNMRKEGDYHMSIETT